MGIRGPWPLGGGGRSVVDYVKDMDAEIIRGSMDLEYTSD